MGVRRAADRSISLTGHRTDRPISEKTRVIRAARAEGRKRYFTGLPCRYGHVAERFAAGGTCVECNRIATRDNYAKPETKRARREYGRRRLLGGIDPPRPEPDACDLCGSRPRTGWRLAMDHDHVTKAFRGWLCTGCNVAIAKLGDDVAGLRRALAYLEGKTNAAPPSTKI